jgi:hypothetical protein
MVFHNYLLNWEAIMRLRTTGILSLGAMALCASAARSIPAMDEAAEIYRRASDHPLLFEALKRSNPS